MQRPACTLKRFFLFYFYCLFHCFFFFFCFCFVQDPGDEPRYLLIRHTKKGPLTFIDSSYQKGTFKHLLIHHTKKAPFNIYWFIISKGTIDLAHEHLFFYFLFFGFWSGSWRWAEQYIIDSSYQKGTVDLAHAPWFFLLSLGNLVPLYIN